MGEKEECHDEDVWIGPDLNESRTPLDKKLYRQLILKKNGLRILLISDTVAMMEGAGNNNNDYDDDDDDYTDSSDEEDEDKEEDGSEEDEEEEDGFRQAACAVVVRAGSYDDPEECQGMAHFLEHMLFMGTEKYPEENAYYVFVSQNGGSDNAYTEYEYTLYHLEIIQEKLFAGMDMLAEFFSGTALLRPDAVERELQSIDAEFQLSVQNDSCRQQQLYCQTSSSFATEMFSWGNLESLKHKPQQRNVDCLAKLREFYNQHYYAQNMSVVVMGAYSLDDLQRRVISSFQVVPPSPSFSQQQQQQQQQLLVEDPWKTIHDPTITNTTDYHRRRDCPFFHNNHHLSGGGGSVYRMVPVKDRHSLTITWQVPPQKEHWRSKPCDYIASLLGHESSGSLLSFLKDRQWVETCYAGVGNGGLENASTHALFTMTYTLTQQGVHHWATIVECTYHYIGMMRHYFHTQSMPSWIFEDLQRLSQLSFLYQEESSPIDTVEELAEILGSSTLLPPDRLLDGNHLFFDHDPSLIQHILDDHLTPHNNHHHPARVDILSSSFQQQQQQDDENWLLDGEPVQVEPYFGTQYWCHAISKSIIETWIEAWQPQLPPNHIEIHLPPKNPFIPTNLTLKALPPQDAHHPLLFCSLKLCISVGKKKSWFPASVMEYNQTNQKLLLSYEDEETKWHKLDSVFEKGEQIKIDAQGTLDEKDIKFKIVAIPKHGHGAMFKYGDDSDHHVQDGIHFPPIPPALSKSRLPQLVHNTKMLKLWHLQDRKFKRPIAELRLKIVSAEVNQTPLDKACAELFTILCSDAATEIAYLASECDIHYCLASRDYGFSLRIYGYNDKLLDLTRELFTLFFTTTTLQQQPNNHHQQQRFESCLEQYNRKLTNIGMTASTLCTNIRLGCIRPTLWSAFSKAKAMENVTMDIFCERASRLLRKVSIEAFYHGNVNLEDAKEASKLITNMMLLSNNNNNNKSSKTKPPNPLQLVTMVPLSKECQPLILPTLNSNDPNSAVEKYFQIGRDDTKNRTLIDLLSQILHEPFYDQVRTKDQFGYSVSCEPRWSYGVIGMSFRIITSSKSASDASDRIDRFMNEIRSYIVTMKDETFMETMVGLAKIKLQMFNSLEEECNHLWSEIVERRYEWESYRNEVIALRSLTKQDVIKAFDDWFLPVSCCDDKGSSKKRRQLAVLVVGNGDNESQKDLTTCMKIEEKRMEIDNATSNYHKSVKNNTWGKIY